MNVLTSAVSTLISIPFKIYKWILDTFLTLDISKKAPVFITGCDSGFGHLLALKLIQNGISTFAGCLTEAGETELRKAAGSAPGKLWTVRLDVTRQSSVDKAFQFVKQTLGHEKGLWGLVNNAGVAGYPAPDDWLTVDEYQKTLDVNFLGVVRVTHTFKPLLKLERGRIVVVTSIFGRIAFPTCGPYCASKYAAEAYCDVVRRELAPFGVSVHILEPGFFATNLANPTTVVPATTALWERLSPEVKEQYGEEYFKGAVDAITTQLPKQLNSNLYLVVDAYYDALTSCCPSRRYYCGNDAKIFYVPLSMLPGAVQDWVVELMLKATGAPVPKVAASVR